MKVHSTQKGEKSLLKRAWNYMWNKEIEEDQGDPRKRILMSVQALGYPARENKKR
jgi:hypothetical protein